ncbi:unnamed protein product, partial [Porites lobata]
NTPSLHSPQNCYLVSLAIVDILNAVVCIPITLKLAVSIKGKWDFSDVICQLQGKVLQIKVDQVSLVVGRWPGIDVLVIRLKSPSVDKSCYKTITTLVVYS